MNFKTAILSAAAAVAFAPAAFAQDAYEGLYGAVGAGFNTSDGGDENWISPNQFGGQLNTGTVEYNYENGVAIYSAIGYAYGNGLRTELEYQYRSQDIDTLIGLSAGPGASGETRINALMANAIYDIPTFGYGSRLQPYVGVGVGGAITNIEAAGQGPATGGASVSFNEGDTGLAYQGIAGLGVELTENLIFDVSYRYFYTQDAKIETGTLGYYEADYDAHTVLAGLRWNFGGRPAPAPEPQYKQCWDGSEVLVSQSCPPQIIEETQEIPDDLAFTVYFEFNKATLTDENRTLISQASQQALSNDVDTVVVEGNTDTSGSSAYNQVLSQRRAAVVRDALVANGVPAGAIVVRANGENNLAKPTADGVREPLNRRSDVTISFE